MRKSNRHKNRAKLYAILSAYHASLPAGSKLPVGSKEIKLAELPQPWVLQEHMQKVGIKHGQGVLVNLNNVKIAVENGMSKLYFCPLEKIQIVSAENGGDSNELPERVSLPKKLCAPDFLAAGYYDLTNMHVYANGTIQLTQTSATQFIRKAKVPV